MINNKCPKCGGLMYTNIFNEEICPACGYTKVRRLY